MKKFRMKRIILFVLIMLLMLSSPLTALAKAPNDSKDVAKIREFLKSLTPEQLSAIKSFDVEPADGVYISPDIDTSSHRNIDVIVEFKADPAKIAVIKNAAKGKMLSFSAAEKQALDAHRAFQNEIKQFKLAGTIDHEYHHAFNGVSMRLPANQVLELKRSQVVKSVWPDLKVYLDPEESKKIDDSASPMMHDSLPLLGVPQLHNMGITGEGVSVGVIDTGIDYNHPDLEDVYKGGYDFVDEDDDPMETTYEDWLNSGMPEYDDRGYAYYTEHGTHVSGTIAAQGKNEGVDYAVKGVAPGVDLYVYRVLGPYGTGTSSDILAAIDEAVEKKLDVINLSLGNSLNDPYYATSVALNNAMLAGTVAVTSAGNSGPKLYTLGSPGASALAITVGASDSPIDLPIITGSVQTDQGTFTYNLRTLAYNTMDGYDTVENQSYEIIDAGLGYDADFEGKDFTGKIAFIKRGEIPFVDKIANAKEAGAAAAIIWNNIPGYIPHYLGDSFEFIPTFNMSYEDGQELHDLIMGNNGTLLEVKPELIVPDESIQIPEVSEPVRPDPANPIQLEPVDPIKILPIDPSIINPTESKQEKSSITIQGLSKENSTLENPLKNRSLEGINSQGLQFTFGEFSIERTPGDLLASFSSRGPANQTFDIKPDVTAPGVSVFSTVPAFLNDPENEDYQYAYARLSGTSMASPHVAGVAALILSEHPNYSPFDVKTALMNNAVDLKDDYSVFEVGAGRINALASVMSTMKFQVHDTTKNVENGELVDIEEITGSISFGLFEKSQSEAVSDSRLVKITNNGDIDKSFNVSVEYLEPNYEGLADPEENGVELDVDSSITVAKGETIEINPKITIPAYAKEGGYQGYIRFVNDADADEQYRIPFVAFYGSAGQKGIEYVIMDPLAFSPNGDNVMDTTDIYFGYYNQMKSTDILLWSPDGPTETSGYLGVIGSLTAVPQGYWVIPNWDGSYYPFIIQNGRIVGFGPKVTALDGYYTVDFYAYDAEDNEYVAWGDVFIDTEGPTLNLDQNSGFYTVDGSFDLSGSIYDEGIEVMANEGYNINQSFNKVSFNEQFSGKSGELVIDKNGQINGTLSLNGASSGFFTIRGQDFAGNTVTKNRYLLFDEHAQYALLTASKKVLLPGEEFTVTLTAKNVENLYGSQFTLSYDPNVFEYVDYEIHQKFAAFATTNDVETIPLFTQLGSDERGNQQIALGASFKGELNNGMSGDVPVLNATFRVIDDQNNLGPATIYVDEAKYVDVSLKSTDLLTTGKINKELNIWDEFNIIPNYPIVTGTMLPEAFKNQQGKPSRSLDQIGATVKLKDPDGQEIAGTINELGYFEVHVRQPKVGSYQFILDVPGHFKAEKKITFQKDSDGKWINMELGVFELLAGDLDHDHKIDIYDVAHVAKYFGKEVTKVPDARMADINQDGTVNVLDLSFVVANFMKKNPFVDSQNVAEPVEFLPNGMSLEKFLNRLIQ